MAAQKDHALIDKIFIPKVSIDPKLLIILRALAPQLVGTNITYAMFGLAFYHFGLIGSAYAGLFYCVTNLLGLLILKAGFIKAFRPWVVLTTWISIGWIDISLGSDSYFWFWYIILLAQNYYVTLDHEKKLRAFAFIGTPVFMTGTFIIDRYHLFRADTTSADLWWIRNFATFTIIYAGSMLAYYAIFHYRETQRYQKRIEEQASTMIQQAKMSSLGEMAAGVAHEINNPLGIILGKVQGIKSRTQRSEMDIGKLEIDCQKVEEVVQRIARIVSSLREFSRDAEKDPFQPYKCAEIIQDTLNFCRENLKSQNVDLQVTGAGNFDIDCRHSQISQVLVNMINNSYDAIKQLPDKWIAIHCEKLGEYAEISITDSGGGIPAAVADKIMQPFFTTKDLGKGTGLGLSAAKGIVEAHGGAISLDRSSPNTKFVVELPLKQGSPTAVNDQTAGLKTPKSA